jgi:hypothetical protein
MTHCLVLVAIGGMQMEHHVKILGILFIVWGILSIMFGFLIVFVLVGTGLITGDEEVMAFIMVFGIGIAAISCLAGLFEIIAGTGLLTGKKWSRVLVIIVAIVNLFDVPMGTALGIYALWVIFKPETQKLLVA